MDFESEGAVAPGEAVDSSADRVEVVWKYGFSYDDDEFKSLSDTEDDGSNGDRASVLTETQLAEHVRLRRIKDSYQDAYLDLFLLENDQGYFLERTGDVQERAKEFRLFEKMQTFLDSKKAGALDGDINNRLESRRELLRRSRNLQEERPTAVLKSARDLLHDNLAAQKSQGSMKPRLLSLKDTAEREALKALADAIDQDRKTTIFAVGGTLPTPPCSHQDTVHETQGTTRTSGSEVAGSVRLWWKTAKSEARLRFPLSKDESTLQIRSFADACQPATFGRGQKDILDESYRKAGKLDPADFLTDFCPYKSGIIDQIEQMLCASQHDGRIVCELYKLNVYSAPSGRFRSHVDTPQGRDHFASLVVCLPTTFRGGDLEVRHDGRSEVFEWDVNGWDVQWAAFYSDCEHEVKQIHEGHRVTLTYNLVWVVKDKQNLLGVDPATLLVFRQLKALLKNPGFFPRGAVFGLPCSHYYAHNSLQPTTEYLPSNLKGSDRALFLSLKRLKLENDLSVILSNDANQYGGISIDEFYRFGGIEISQRAQAKLKKFRRRGFDVKKCRFGGDTVYNDLRLTYIGEDHGDDPYHSSHDDRFDVHKCAFDNYPFKARSLEDRITELQSRWVKGIDPEYRKGTDVIVNHTYDGISFLDEEREDTEFDDMIDQGFPHSRLSQILWLQHPKEGPAEAVQMAYIAHGNQATLEWRYSRPAIIFIFPPWGNRSDGNQPSDTSGSMPEFAKDDKASNVLGKRIAAEEEDVDSRPTQAPRYGEATASTE